MPSPVRRTARLRWGRVSVPGATYFVTACTHNRQRIFDEPFRAKRAVEVLNDMHAAHDICILTAVIMPDHVHLLFTLGTRLRLGQVIGKFKSLTIRGDESWDWQQDGFERQLRPGEASENYGLYVFMNPYRARLSSLDARWPWWLCPLPDQFRFLSLLGTGPVPSEWIDRSIAFRARLTTRL